jgi:hypothetical protein
MGSEGQTKSEAATSGRATCSTCGSTVQPDEVFCTSCGSALPSGGGTQEAKTLESADTVPASNASDGADDGSATRLPVGSHVSELPDESTTRSELVAPERPIPSPVDPVEPAASPKRRNRKPWAIALGIISLLLVAALAGAIILWQREKSAHQKTSSQLVAARAQIASLQSQLTTTKSRLQRTQALSARQQAILVRTAAVLAKVDPLLSGADELQQLTSGIQSTRDSFSSDSDLLVSDMVTLGNDLIDAANASGVDLSYLNDEIDTVNNEIDTVRGEAESLSSSDSSYNDASQRFGTRASNFTATVRALQRELRKLKTQ